MTEGREVKTKGREAMPRRPWERTRRWGQGEAGVQLLRREGRGPGLEGAPQRCAYSSSQQRSAVVSSSSDQAQGPGHCYPAATPGAGAQGSRRLTAPHPPTQGQYGTRERQAVEPGEPECLWSPAPLDLPGPPWRREDSPGNGHGLLSGVGPASGDLGMPHSPTAQE